MQRVVRSTLAAAMLLVLPGAVLGQEAGVAGIGGTWTERPLFDYFVSRFTVTGTGQPSEQDAVGGRLMWSLAGERGGLLSRTLVGGYLIHSPDEKSGRESWRYGAQADLRLAPTPLAGRLDPIVSLGVGALQALEEPRATPALRAATAGLLLPPQRRTSLSVAPGVGLRFRLFSGLGVRGDARQVVDFRDGTRKNLEFSGGLTLGV